jgi:hypothetical protein
MNLSLQTLQEAANLYNRYQAGAGFKAYVRSRMNLVLPMAALILLTAVACTAGSVVCLAGARAYLMLFVLLLAPFVLIGSLFVQSFFFFGWLENRALAKGLKHGLEPEGPLKRWLRKQLHAEVGKFPPVPWLFAAVFLLLPLVMTALVAPRIAAALVLLQVAALLLYSRLDR